MKTSDDFVHLHVRSEYTLLASTLRCRDLAEQTAGLGMPAVALTDRGTLAGLFEFQREARRAGIKPIPGYEACLAPGSRLDKKEIDGRARTTKLTLLAQNDRGWANLLKLANRGGLEGEYRGRPRIDRELLRAHAEGMICLTGGSAGPVGEWLAANQPDRARETLRELAGIYGRDNLFVEVHDHATAAGRRTREEFVALARELNLRLVATNDVRFLKRDDHAAHDILTCISRGKLVLEDDRPHFPAGMHLKSPAGMRAAFRDLPEACDATLEIAERCVAEPAEPDPDGHPARHHPRFPLPEGWRLQDSWREICHAGLEARYGARRVRRYHRLRRRLDFEIETLFAHGLADANSGNMPSPSRDWCAPRENTGPGS